MLCYYKLSLMNSFVYSLFYICGGISVWQISRLHIMAGKPNRYIALWHIMKCFPEVWYHFSFYYKCTKVSISSRLTIFRTFHQSGRWKMVFPWCPNVHFIIICKLNTFYFLYQRAIFIFFMSHSSLCPCYIIFALFSWLLRIVYLLEKLFTTGLLISLFSLLILCGGFAI